jgi:hypothetical protein
MSLRIEIDETDKPLTALASTTRMDSNRDR